MVKIYILKFSSAFKFEDAFLYLSEEDKKEALKLKNEKRRNQFVYSRSLLKYIVLKAGFEYGKILKKEKGKPYFSKGFPFFSISHSGNYVAVAISDYNIGLDIQKEKNISPDVVKKIFTYDEQELMKKKIISPAYLWCVKESVLKYDGNSIFCNIKDTEVFLKSEKPKIKNRDDLCINTFFVKDIFISLCSATDDCELFIYDQ